MYQTYLHLDLLNCYIQQNIEPIFVTSDVSKADKSIDVIFHQKLKVKNIQPYFHLQLFHLFLLLSTLYVLLPVPSSSTYAITEPSCASDISQLSVAVAGTVLSFFV